MGLVTRPFHKDYRWVLSTVVDHEQATVENMAGALSTGKTTVIEAAADGQYERKKLLLDAAIGLAVPFGISADPWPEGKLVTK